MGAKHVINPNQLTLFERAGDLADPTHFYPGDALRFSSPNYEGDLTPAEGRSEVKEEKLNESRDNGLYYNIMRNGVHEPVHVTHKDDGDYGLMKYSGATGVDTSRGFLSNGHHRVYSQADIDPKAWVPVKWSDEPEDR